MPWDLISARELAFPGLDIQMDDAATVNDERLSKSTKKSKRKLFISAIAVYSVWQKSTIIFPSYITDFCLPPSYSSFERNMHIPVNHY